MGTLNKEGLQQALLRLYEQGQEAIEKIEALSKKIDKLEDKIEKIQKKSGDLEEDLLPNFVNTFNVKSTTKKKRGRPPKKGNRTPEKRTRPRTSSEAE
mmetsp:Transcript_15555/g.17581  ORF Transcript_15555/g.17581 Transcript_15555/m.17581 type:complete len:98 (+) Transcript_15555:57-350(+)